MVEGRDGGGGVHIVIYIRIGISLGLERGRKVYFRESKNMAIEMSLNQGRLVHYPPAQGTEQNFKLTC